MDLCDRKLSKGNLFKTNQGVGAQNKCTKGPQNPDAGSTRAK